MRCLLYHRLRVALFLLFLLEVLTLDLLQRLAGLDCSFLLSFLTGYIGTSLGVSIGVSIGTSLGALLQIMQTVPVPAFLVLPVYPLLPLLACL